MEIYKKYEHLPITGKLYNLVLCTSRYPIIEEYLKIYLQTDRGKQEINLKDKHGWTALMSASKYSNKDSSIETVKLLIENGADVNLQNYDGNTALMIVSEFLKTQHAIETMKILIDNGAN